MANVVLGKIAITWKGVYNTGTTYYQQDVVSYGANTYICTATSTTGTFVTADWDTFAQGTLDITTTAGDMIYNDGTNLVRLPIGTSGQVLGINTTTNLPEWQSIPSRSSRHVAYLGAFKGITTNNQNTFVALTDGSLVTWGYGGVHAIPTGSDSANKTIPQIAAFPRGFPGVDTNKFFMRHDYGFFCLDQNGDMWSWGRVQNGITGNGTSKTAGAVSQYIPYNVMTNTAGDFYINSTKATSFSHSGGDADNCSVLVIGTDQKVYSWGYNAHGQLGLGDTTERHAPVMIPYFDTNNINIVKVDQGRDEVTTSAAISDTGVFYIWGDNSTYILGIGATTSDRLEPAPCNGGSLNGKTVTDCWMGAYMVYVKDSTGSLHFIGGDYYGSSGLGINTSSTVSYVNTPTLTWDTSTRATVTKMAVSNYNYPCAFVIDADGDLYFTGYSGYGSSGLGDNANKSTWTQVNFPDLAQGETIIDVKQRGTGSYNSTGALTSEGRLFTWGYNGYGQLGLGDTTNVNSPVEVPFNAGAITDWQWTGHAQYGKLVVLNDDGRVFNCGYGDNNDLAQEDAEEYYTLQPVRI